jgi:hypothetical protein
MVEKSERVCEVCGSNDIEDEYHFILTCTKYKSVRKRYIDNYYYERPSVFKLTQLFKSKNVH